MLWQAFGRWGGVQGSGGGGGGERPPGIQFIGRTTATAEGGSSPITIPLDLINGIDTAPIEGDFILIMWAGASSANDLNPTAPTGYTQLLDIQGNDTHEANLVVWYKFAEAGDLESVTVPNTGNASWACAAHVRVFSGVNESTPFDVTTTTEVGSNSGANPPAITPSTAGSYIVAAGCAADADMAHMTNDTADLSDFVSTMMADAVDIVLASGMKTNWVSGAFDPGGWGNVHSTSADSHASATMVLRPA